MYAGKLSTQPAVKMQNADSAKQAGKMEVSKHILCSKRSLSWKGIDFTVFCCLFNSKRESKMQVLRS
jgi:hypothetical protein